jgi:hypothetical protein
LEVYGTFRAQFLAGVIISMHKYLKSGYTNEDILLRNVFSESKYLYENGQKSWFSSMESLVRYLNISPNIFKLPGIDMKSLFLNKLHTNNYSNA